MSDLYIVTVRFTGIAASKKEYDFVGYEEYSPGDLVVVDTEHGFGIAIVTAVSPVSDENNLKQLSYVLKEVVSKVDVTNFENRKRKREEKNQLRWRMDEIVQKLKEDDVYDIYAEKSPELKALLEKYRNL